jgi:hypothetical protein
VSHKVNGISVLKLAKAVGLGDGPLLLSRRHVK